jgi:phytoene/squalene synthetase
VGSDLYRQWVARRVQLAREYFAAGRRYLAGVENARCRLAGCAYIARFEGVLDAIEREGYRLRNGYSECKGAAAIMRGCRLALTLRRSPIANRQSRISSTQPVTSRRTI